MEPDGDRLLRQERQPVADGDYVAREVTWNDLWDWACEVQPYPVREMGEAMGGSQCRGVTWGQHHGGLRATYALGWWTGRGRTLGTRSALNFDYVSNLELLF